MEKNDIKNDNVLDDLLTTGTTISRSLSSDPLAAAFAIDNLPGDVKKDALYAGLAVRLASMYDEAKKHEQQTTTQLLQTLLDYTKSKSTYLGRKE